MAWSVCVCVRRPVRPLGRRAGGWESADSAMHGRPAMLFRVRPALGAEEAADYKRKQFASYCRKKLNLTTQNGPATLPERSLSPLPPPPNPISPFDCAALVITRRLVHFACACANKRAAVPRSQCAHRKHDKSRGTGTDPQRCTCTALGLRLSRLSAQRQHRSDRRRSTSRSTMSWNSTRRHAAPPSRPANPALLCPSHPLPSPPLHCLMGQGHLSTHSSEGLGTLQR
jgi:hypothetical protein